MEPLKQINNIDIRINSLRLELIKIIADINNMVRTNNAKTRQKEYDALKSKYYETNQLVEALNEEKKRIQTNSVITQKAA